MHMSGMQPATCAAMLTASDSPLVVFGDLIDQVPQKRANEPLEFGTAAFECRHRRL